MSVESELAWFKSSYSSGDGGECVEIAESTHTVHVRDSKDVSRQALAVSQQAWVGFVGLAADSSVA